MSGSRPNQSELDSAREFIARHIGASEVEQQDMLQAIGVDSFDALLDRTVPASIRMTESMELEEPVGEAATLAKLRDHAARTKVSRSVIGMGYYPSLTPAVIQRNILEAPAWYTAYTPYQPEVSQGRLEALLNFQTMISDLTAMEIANASLLDEATAAAEAVTLCRKVARAQGDVLFVSRQCHPQTIDVLQTRAEPVGIRVVVGDEAEGVCEEAFAAVVQYPDTNGEIRDYAGLADSLHARGAMLVVAADLLALTLITPPGEWGADVVVGSSQRFGVPLGFGGPHAAFFATREAFKRAMPGRLVGVSLDNAGKPAYRLALQTREQHIRREKATSNICTSQVLLAVMASMYAVYHGPQGLRRIARRVHRMTVILAQGLRDLGYEVETSAFFDTITVKTDDWTASVIEAARVEKINVRIHDQKVGISLDETCTRETIVRLWMLMTFASMKLLSFERIDAAVPDRLPASMLRRSEYLTHPIFNSHHSETAMLRYLRKLADKDLALDRSMIPLGSCTMKLNATTEMMPITWPEFSQIHPFAPKDQVEGYIEMIRELEQMLCACTGYAAVSLQPNAGSQGEFTGLMMIRAYHRSRGEEQRDICLIPNSAHGTNPASAAMAGMRVVVVQCDDRGNVDLVDLSEKAARYADRLAALMVTYPSTHGVFEDTIVEICAIIHDHGGQVYLDGANLNAMVGLCQPGRFGSDVSHLNLHKTFCIPHGGGGPGVGPVAVASHLAPFLPGHRFGPTHDLSIGPVSAAPWGSAGILPIAWAYITMMGAEGMRDATLAAVLSANYLATRLAEHYPLLYCGAGGMVAHECIIDLRPLKETAGVSVEDIAKRLIDHGFHAPTISFPVPGTLMIEPTESEPKAELDRFVSAMAAIREEVRAIETGEIAYADSPLAHAPHTASVLIDDHWDRRYSRAAAAFPDGVSHGEKYWPPVGRIDNVHGDRNLVCTCPPIAAYADAAD